MSLEICHCPRCKAGDEAPHEYHLERRPMPSDYVCAACRTPLAAGYTCHVCGCEEAEDADGVLAVSPAADPQRNALRPDHGLAQGLCLHNVPMTQHCAACATEGAKR